MKRMSISLSEELLKELQKLKKKNFEDSYSELIRMVLEKGLEKMNEEKAK